MEEDDNFEEFNREDAEDGLYLFARALSMLLYENEGIVVYAEDEETGEPLKYIVYTTKGYVQVIETEQDLEEGEMVHMRNLGDINLN